MRINRFYKKEGLNKRINRKCVQRIMKKYGIVCPIRKANPYRKMSKATKEHRVVKNIVNREFKPEISGSGNKSKSYFINVKMR